MEVRQLREILDPERGYVRGPFGSALVRKELKEAGIPVYEQQHAITGTREFRYFISDSKFKELARFRTRPHDLIISCSGTVGRISIVEPGEPEGVISQALLILRPNTEIVRSKYLYYFLSSLVGQQALLNASQGAVQLNIAPRAVVEAIEMPAPPIEEQDQTIAILESLDNKIEVNRRMATTLEEMARVAFRAWFVDFLPVRAKVSARVEGRDRERAAMSALSGRDEGDLDALPPETFASLAATVALFPDDWDGSLPTGWTEGTLDQLARMVTTSVQPSNQPDAIFEHYSIPAFDEGNGPAMDRGDSIKSGKYAVHRDAVLVSKLNPNTPRIWMPNVNTDRAISSTEFMQFVPHDPKARAFLYLLMQSAEMQEAVLMRVTGSTGSRQRAQPSQIATLPISLPPSSLITAFCERFVSLVELANRLQHERVALARLRDALLPRLMSGGLPGVNPLS